MEQYAECRDCGFVLRTETAAEGPPKNWERCPDCGGTDFGAVD